MNIINQLIRTGRRRPDAVALHCGDTALTFGDLLDRAGRLAARLTAEGLQPGDRVAFHLPNSPDWLPAWAGVLQAGGIVVPVNYLFNPTAIRHVAEDSGASWFLVADADVPRALDLLDGLPVAERVISTRPAAGACWALSELGGEPQRAVVPRLDGAEAMVMYTSGSTGVPKGVRQTHRNTAAQCEAVQQVWSLGPEDHALVCTPLFHVGGLQLISLPTLLAGGTVTLMTRWDKRQWVELAVSRRPTLTALVPTMMIDVANDRRDDPLVLDSFRVVAVGGSALPEGPLRRFSEATGITCVRNIYGQTEQNGLSATEPLDEPQRTRSLGRPLEQVVEWQVVPLGEREPTPRGSGVVGELWVRGDAVTPGYWHNPGATADRFTDGWFRTADMVTADADGYLYYVERTDDLIISGGENVFPQMVENHLASSPLIAEVAVIGTPHERYVQQVTAVVVPVDPATTAEDVAAWCRTHPDLQGLQRPRRIEIVDELPRTGNSKIDRMSLKRRYAESRPTPVG